MTSHERYVHPQLQEVYKELYDELREEGLSDQEACQRLMTDFDWSLSELRRPILRKRTDKFVETEKQRSDLAERGEDICQVWLALKLGGLSEEMLIKFNIECLESDYTSAVLWIIRNKLLDIFIFGQKILAVGQNVDPESR